MTSFFDADYFERGLSSKKSCYQNYQWLPDLTIPMAFRIMHELKISPGDSVLDFGCSKGFLVKALRLLGVDAYGVDASEYAIANCDSDVRKYCKLVSDTDPTPFKQQFNWIISKDVLEHLTTVQLHNFLNNYTPLGDRQFHVIPLGDNGIFRIDEYHLDRSHIQINDEQWWTQLFQQHGWSRCTFKHQVVGIKDNWYQQNPQGDGFFLLTK